MKYGQAAKMYLDSCKASGKTACTLQSYGRTGHGECGGR